MRRELCITSWIRRRESFPQRSPRKSEQSKKSATSSAPKKDHLQQARSRGSFSPENSAVHLSDGGMDTDHKEKGSKGSSSWSFCASVLKGEQKEDRRGSCSILPRRSLHRESGIAPISDDEPTAPGEEPPQLESRRRRNQCRNIRRHHEAGERDPAQPVSRDEVSEMGETPEERVFRERRNSRRRDRRRGQEHAEQETTTSGKSTLRAQPEPRLRPSMNTPSEVGGVLARIADGLPQTPDAEGYWRLFTQAVNHLLPLAHPSNDLRHAINSRQDARSSINASRERRHENEIRRREEYDRDHDIPARSQATRTESATTSTGGTTRGQSRHHDNHSPPRDRQHHRRQEDTCGVSALTPRLRAIQCPPNFKVSNVDKYEPKQDPGGWLVVYTTAARAAGATEDVMTTYLPIVLGQDALQWLRHLPRHCIDD
jgi:hypothetical protein